MTFVATANVVELLGARPVFVDVDPETLLVSTDLVARAVTPRTKAVIPVHIYGQMVDIPAVRVILRDRPDIAIIEDCAHCFEGELNGQKPGTQSSAAIFSFYATKNVTCGEGGAIVTNDFNLFQKLLQARIHSMSASAIAALADQPGQDLDYARRADAAIDIDRQCLLSELVSHRQTFELLTIGTTIEHEIVRPHLVRSARRLWPRPARSHALARPLARHLQSRRLPQPVSSPWAHPMPVATEKNADAPIAVARILHRQLLHPLNDRRVLAELPALVAQRHRRPLDQRAAPPHRETTLPAIHNLPPTGRHAHQFFAATSFMISISRSRSATSFFSRAFSASSCFRRLTSF